MNDEKSQPRQDADSASANPASPGSDPGDQPLSESLDQLTSLDVPQRDQRLAELTTIDAELASRLRELLNAHAGDMPSPQGISDTDAGMLQSTQAPRAGLPPVSGGDPQETDVYFSATTDGAVTGERPSRSRLPNHFQVVDKLGAGGMGTVLLARDTLLNRMVALKQPLYLGNEAAQKRFLEEARTAAGLRHPSICAIFDVYPQPECPLIVMEFVEGESLDKWHREHQPDANQASRIVAQIAHAVQYAHQQGIIHRDIKPQNVLIRSGTDDPVLMDFGLAKRLSPDRPSMTGTGLIVGTPAFMSPEQATGDADSVGAPTDVYALGAVLYYLLTGQPPFAAANRLELLKKVSESEPSSPRKLKPRMSRDLETICLKAMSKRQQDRYASAGELAADLERFSRGEAVLARREIWLRRTFRRVYRERRLTTVVAAALVLVAAILGWAWWQTREAGKVGRLASTIRRQALATDWSAREREELDRQLARLRSFSPQDADREEQELIRLFGNELERRIQQPVSLGEEQSQPIRDGLAWLARRDSEAAALLTNRLQNRLRSWQRTLRVVSPLKELPEQFQAEDWTLVDGRPRRRSRPERDFEPTVNSNAAPIEAAAGASSKIAVRFANLNARPQGVAINADSKGGYQFLIRRSVAPPAKTDPTVGEILLPKEKALEVQAKILRDDITLRDVHLRLPRIKDSDPILLVASRDQHVLELEVAGQSVKCFDFFSLPASRSGQFGIVCPDDASILEVRIERKQTASAPTALENADALLQSGDIEAALQMYRDYAVATGNREHQVAAQYKAARCLLELERTGEALSLLHQLSIGDVPQPWKLLAQCQALIVYLRDEKDEEAAAMLATLGAGNSSDEIAFAMPQAERERLLKFAFLHISGSHLLYVNDKKLAEVKRGVQIQQVLDPECKLLHWDRRWFLSRAYHVRGRWDDAIQIADSAWRESRDYAGLHTQFFEEYCWLLRLKGRHAEALSALDRIQDQAKARGQGFLRELKIERARILANMGQFDAAEKELAEFFDELGATATYRDVASARLLQGWLRLQAGDRPAALEIWKKGVWERFAEERNESLRRPMNGFEIMPAVQLAVLTGELTDENFFALLEQTRMGPSFDLSQMLPGFRGFQGVLAGSARKMFDYDPSGEILEKIVLRQIPLNELVIQHAKLVAASFAVDTAFGDRWTPEARGWTDHYVDVLIPAMVDATLSNKDRLSSGHLVSAAMMFRRGTGPLVYNDSVAGQFPPQLQRPFKLLLAYRYRKIGAEPTALRLFRQIADDPGDGEWADWMRETAQREWELLDGQKSK